MDDWERLSARLLEVRTPGQYVGGEWNAGVKPFGEAAVRAALVFPDTYAVGMSGLGTRVVRHLFNRRPDALADRFFAPEPDLEALLRAEGLPLLGLDTRRPLRDFDLVAFSFQYETLLTNLLNVLDLGRIPLRREERGEGDPLVVAGGGACLAPEPASPFIDLFLAGDGEAIVDPLVETWKALKAARAPRAEALAALVAAVPGAYAPALYDRRPSASGARIPRPRPGTGAPERVRAAVWEDLEGAPVPSAPAVPCVEAPQDRIALEIMRGCPHGCRFCEAGYTRKPVRWRSPASVLELAEASYAATGYDEISLLALSAGDYPGLGTLVRDLHARFDARRVNVSLPSLRVGEGVAELPHLLRAVRKSGLTLAPEAGERLRAALNKPVRDEDLLAAAAKAWEEGWRTIKLYFMVGLPGETGEDLDAIADLSDRVARLRGKFARTAGTVNVTLSPFVPRPHTPFQWEPQARPEAVFEAQRRVTARRRIPSVKFKAHSPDRALVEGFLARGDETAGAAALAAFRAGARFDAWDDRFDLGRWRDAWAATGTGPEDVLFRARPPDEALPWGVIDPGVPVERLLRERDRAAAGLPTPSCGPGRCPGLCGTPGGCGLGAGGG
ncbi:MAG: TIGR03960 family B12-binding radical SAM protein [Planctomycetes bacterium]|nr:TIGR03960 family B12-binding radical SAM protein [Planctomycetota bacterium]